MFSLVLEGLSKGSPFFIYNFVKKFTFYFFIKNMFIYLYHIIKTMETRNEHLEYLLFRIEALQNEVERLKLENLKLIQKYEFKATLNEVLTEKFNQLNYGN